MSLVVFFVASFGVIATAFAVVLQKNPFISAIALLGNFASLAALYLTLQADFVAAAQVIVYAGAVMVMFLFVIAYIGPRAELGSETTRRWQRIAAGVAAAAILAEVAVAVGRHGLGTAASVDSSFGSPAAVGERFLTDYLFAFEVVSVLLLVAAVVAVVLGAGPRPTRVVDPRDDVRRAASRRLVAAATGEDDR